MSVVLACAIWCTVCMICTFAIMRRLERVSEHVDSVEARCFQIRDTIIERSGTEMPKLGPYRDASPPPEPPSLDSSRPLTIVPFKNPYKFICPKCDCSWIWNKGYGPTLCSCSKDVREHFHLRCVGGERKTDTNGCGAQWVMLAKDAKTEVPSCRKR